MLSRFSVTTPATELSLLTTAELRSAAGVTDGTGPGLAGPLFSPAALDSEAGSGGGMGLGLSSTCFGTAGTRLGSPAAGTASGTGVLGNCAGAGERAGSFGGVTAAACGRGFNGPLSWLISASKPVTIAIATSQGMNPLFFGGGSRVASWRGFRAGGNFTAGKPSATVGALRLPPRVRGFHPRVAAHARSRASVNSEQVR